MLESNLPIRTKIFLWICHWPEAAGNLSEFGYLAELGLVEDLDFTAFDDYQLFRHEGSQGAYGI